MSSHVHPATNALTRIRTTSASRMANRFMLRLYRVRRLPTTRVEGSQRRALHTHRVVPAVDVEGRARHVARLVAEEVGSRRADVLGVDVTVERRSLLDDRLHRREAGDR